MAKTISEAFRQLRSNLEITELQEATVSTRQNRVRAALEDDFTVLDSFLTGSYRRNTMIAPLKEADVDIFIVLDSKHFEQYGQAALLEKVKRALRKTYPDTPDISPDGQAVTITFTDFRVDVVPGFYRKGGGYLIPDSQMSRWISTDPKKHVEVWAAANRAHNGDLVPLIKMVKGWNKSRGVFRSFHLETLLVRVFENVKITDYPSGLRYAFDKSRARVRLKLPDPAGVEYGDDVAAHVPLGPKTDEIVGRLDYACGVAQEAERLEGLGRTSEAFSKWKILLGDYFPAYY